MKPVIAFLPLAACRADADPPAPPPVQPTGHYCDMTALTPDERAHLEGELVPQMVAATRDRTELADGWSFHIDGKFRELGALLDHVRRCCPTIAFAVEFPPHQTVATLRITGPRDAKPFIREEFAKIIAP
jgi:hypothetical protein